ncbi:MAG: glycosyltransferase family 4 protein [Candidatus Bathyarchaeota archaeon]
MNLSKLDLKSIGRTGEPWYIFLARLLIFIPFLRIPNNAIIQTYRLDFMLPFILFCPKNPKVVFSDEPMRVFKTKHSLLSKIVVPLYEIYKQLCLRKIDRLITDEATSRYYQKHGWFNRKITIMPTSGVDLDKFKPMNSTKIREEYGFESDEKIIVFVGRVERIKRIDFLIDSFFLVKKVVPKSRLLIVGSGADKEYEEHLKSMISEYALENVQFTGNSPPESIPKIINCTDVLALCSEVEGSPTVVREAIACGVPVVSTEVGDVRSIIKNDYVGRIAKKDVSDFALCLLHVLKMDKETVKAKCRRLAEELLGFDRLVERYLEVYRELCTVKKQRVHIEN